MKQRKFFGTDGIRGKVGDGKMTPELALKLGWAAGRVLSRNGTQKVIIGKDTRISGYLFESALEAGLSDEKPKYLKLFTKYSSTLNGNIYPVSFKGG